MTFALTPTHLHIFEGQAYEPIHVSPRRKDGKALRPCLTLVNKGDKGLPFKRIHRVCLRMQSHRFSTQLEA